MAVIEMKRALALLALAVCSCVPTKPPAPRTIELTASYGMVVENYPDGSVIVISEFRYEPTKYGPWYRKGSDGAPKPVEGQFIVFIADQLPWQQQSLRQHADGSVYSSSATQNGVALYDKTEGWPNGAKGWERQFLEDPIGS